MRPLVVSAFFPFCGLGAGARGVLTSRMAVLGRDARFRSLGGLDSDPLACADFERLTHSPALCRPVEDVSPALLRAFVGERRPDFVFASPPCKGASGLLSADLAKSPRYQAMNQLALIWARLMLSTWSESPPLFLLENVPRLTARAPEMLAELRRLLGRAGYVFSDGYHNCGELGGLAQNRRRYLLIARRPEAVPGFLYEPPKRRVRACGEVLGDLPLPGMEDAARWGKLHTLPRISWRNWVRLALIPAGGDWRDLAGSLSPGQTKREAWEKLRVSAWEAPSRPVVGPGSNGPQAVADPRWYGGVYGVRDWSETAPTVTGHAEVSTGAFAVADPRVALPPSESRHWNKYAVESWDEPARAVIGATRPGSGAPNVADPRVTQSERWHNPTGYAVLSWEQAARTIAGKTSPGCGAYAVGDPRMPDGRPLSDEYLASLDPDKPPPFVPVIVSADGTWHRPLTTLELAALQGLPVEPDGEPLALAGSSVSGWRERIGNAVPPPAATAIGDRALVAFAEAAEGADSLESGGTIWVEPEACAATFDA